MFDSCFSSLLGLRGVFAYLPIDFRRFYVCYVSDFLLNVDPGDECIVGWRVMVVYDADHYFCGRIFTRVRL